jgi:hypothetical protein
VSDLPVELDQLAVDREYGTSPGSPDPGLDLGKELRIASRQRVALACGRKTSHRTYVPIVCGRNPELLVGRAIDQNGAARRTLRPDGSADRRVGMVSRFSRG